MISAAAATAAVHCPSTPDSTFLNRTDTLDYKIAVKKHFIKPLSKVFYFDHFK